MPGHGQGLPATTSALQVSAAHAAAAVLGTAEAVFTARIAQAALVRARDEPGGVVDSLQPLTGDGDVRAIPMLSSLGWWPTLIVAAIDTGAVLPPGGKSISWPKLPATGCSTSGPGSSACGPG
jgi:hypothetical protein